MFVSSINGMETKNNWHYHQIADAIQYITTHFREQPDLEEIARQVHMSPFHFQRVFTEWAGVSPKKFLQYLSLSHAKQLLATEKLSLADTAWSTGLSGTSRLHDLFITMEGMTPGEFKNGGESLRLHYSYAESPFGEILIASTSKGVCHMAFAESEQAGLDVLREQFPKATISQVTDEIQQQALFLFQKDWSELKQIKLHLKATPFQLKVWEALLKVPMGRLTTYGQLAEKIAHPGAARAVGTAVAQNPVAFLIPCHRVIQSTGQIGQYHWGPSRKAAMVGWESARVETP
jgi:AraC family transcriptional regulator of adaptative response/methylated-DNA-[protein]-cysteine methyltransferase